MVEQFRGHSRGRVAISRDTLRYGDGCPTLEMSGKWTAAGLDLSLMSTYAQA
jgi:hypothetical protein